MNTHVRAESRALLPTLLLLIVYLGALAGFWFSDPSIAAENGLMENLQAGALGLGFLLMASGAGVNKRFEGRFLFSVLTLLFLASFLREVDVEKLALPDILVLLGSGTGRTLLIALPGLLLAILGIRNRHRLKPVFRGFLKTPAFRLFVIGVVLYASGGIFDHHYLGLSRTVDVFLEEFCENAATFCLLAGSVLALKSGLGIL